MFRHKPADSPGDEIPKRDEEPKEKKESQQTEPSAPVKSEGGSLKELMEKNLKWSQIIYEQNRKINSKLLWAAIANWIKILLILIPLALAAWFLPPLLKGILKQYGSLFNMGEKAGGGIGSFPNSMENLIKMLNIDPAKQEQLKGLLK